MDAPAFQAILDPDDPRAEPYRRVRERDAAVRRDGFLVEGAVPIETALRRGRHPLGSILASEAKAPRVSELLTGTGFAGEVFVAAQPVLDAICGFPLHRGLLAFGPSPVLPTAGELLAELPGETVVVCPVGINDPENMGAIFRNAAAFGAAAALLDPSCCDPFYRRAIRVSVGATLMLPSARLAPGEDLIDRLHAHGFRPLALSPGARAPLSAYTRGGRTALLLGAEGPGLPAGLLARAEGVRIPMAPGFDSLNVAVASGVALHHLLTSS